MNNVSLIGRLTKDVELRYSSNANNTAVTSFTIAVDRRFKKPGEEKQADFISCKAFGKTAEFIGKYFAKGSGIALTGHIQTGSYDKEGVKVYTTEVVVDQVYFVGGKSNNASGSSTPVDNGGFDPIEDDDDLPF